MEDLPASLSDPLRYPDPPTYGWLTPIAALLALAAAWWLYRRWQRRRRRALAPVAAALPAGARPPAGGIVATIRAIRSGYGRSKDYRGGCHALADALRDPVGDRLGQSLESATAGEIAALAESRGEGTLAALFRRLGVLQFHRREPGASDFYRVCDHALEAVGSGGRG